MKILGFLCLVTIAGCTSLPAHVFSELHSPAELKAYNNFWIVNGENASIADFPWQASLQSADSHNCGAVVISARKAVTAGHCISPGLKIRVGSDNHFEGGKVFDVSKSTVHPDYGTGAGTFPNDIAVLDFDEDITGDGVKAVEMPTSSSGDFAGQECTITGWGRTSGGAPLPDVLQKAKTTVLSEADCEAEWGADSINAGHVCVFNKETGSCNGDSGGPLTCNGVLVGVTSWGAVGCPVSSPSVYTRITHFLQFIADS
ncbi:fibrinolytic enzyme, isozyme C-like [Mizuhopecten yessoensis]|uniref:Fibrinolytic enzyme, isozyme C n=1 Tax=Mizuhopecten yessoensis TaxID=6573 RepID=A0A210PG15_MIZYE|nr:fibrinolytic enzyme, isozyme C-like [Mizuhopecten yessoensis]OWF35397.1 Fibrinolytic enzyme, isozyme C [Mizuhopecten yessoensis]